MIEIKKRQKEYNRQGCIQFLLFFLLMAVCIILCSIFAGDAFE
jgi:hypothetical protein